MLPIVLIFVSSVYPGMVPVQLERFETMKECREAAVEYDARTLAWSLKFTCEIEV